MRFMTEDSELFLVDTNILVYAFSQEEHIKNKICKSIINKCWNGKANLAVSNQNLAEFVFVSARKAKLSIRQAREIIELIVSFDGFKKINYSAETIISAAGIADKFQMPFWDALLAATMKENNIFNI